MRAAFAVTALFLGGRLLAACASDDGENGGEGAKSGASGAAGSATGGANGGSSATGGSAPNGGSAGRDGDGGRAGNGGGGAGSGAGGSGGAGAMGTGGASGASGSAGASGASGAAGSGAFACGTQTCGAEQYCIVPCCGGAPPICTPKPDGGACPPNTSDEGTCCRQMPCTPAPRYCSDTFAVCTLVNRVCLETCG
jgi:hypothetical protein